MQVARKAFVVIGLALAFGGAMAAERHNDTPSQIAHVADATLLKPMPYPRPPYVPPRIPGPTFPTGPTFPVPTQAFPA